MPWQVVPSYAIIIGMFNLTAFGLWGSHRLATGKDQVVSHDEWSYNMELRDERIYLYRKWMADPDNKKLIRKLEEKATVKRRHMV